MISKLQEKLKLRTDPTIFFASAALVVLFVLVSILATDGVDAAFAAASDWIKTNLGWVYILGVTSFLVFLLWIAFSRYSHVRLGGKEAKPEYSNLSWFGMLFAAGIGTILMFWGVAEPINHFANPPLSGVDGQVDAIKGENFDPSQGTFVEQLNDVDVPGGVAAPLSPEAADHAMGFTLYHFGFHTWAIFALPALAFAYFAYRRGLPFRVSSIFQPLLGERINGPIGKIIDVTAVIGTIFGVAVSIGLGTMQINSGLSGLFSGIPDGSDGKLVQVLIIAVVTTIAVISVALGLDKGIKRLSNFNIGVAVALLLFVVIAGSTIYLLRGVVETTGTYLSHIIPLSFWNDTVPAEGWGWQGGWTVFYWAWTITWAPFVGIFIARISKGRTIREFVLGVLAAPVAFSVIWFSVFGLSSIKIELDKPGTLSDPVVNEGNTADSLFAFLQNFPATELVMAVAIFIVVIFFTTSSDSASLVVDMLCSGGDPNPPVRQRVFWAVLEGVVAATLIAATGREALAALEQVITVLGLPFFVIAFLMMYSLVKALRKDVTAEELLPPRRRARAADREDDTAADGDADSVGAGSTA